MRLYLTFAGVVLVAACFVGAVVHSIAVMATTLLALACVGACEAVRSAFRALTR